MTETKYFSATAQLKKATVYIVLLMLLVSEVGVSSPSVATAIDLRTEVLQPKGSRFTGAWLFYDAQFIDPNGSTAAPTAQVVLPGLWTMEQAGQVAKSAFGYASYSTILYLPSSSERLGLYVPDMYTAYRLYANGRLLSQSGEPGSTPELHMPRWVPQVVPLPLGADSLFLVLHLSNFQHSKGGMRKPMMLGHYEEMQKQKQREEALDLLMSGTMLMGGLFFFGLFLFSSYDRATLYFALFCILYSYRPVGSRWYVLNDMFQAYPWGMSIRLEYFSLYAAVGFFALYTRALFPEEVNKRVVQAFLWACFGFAVSTLLLSPWLFTQTITPFLVVVTGMLFYAVYVFGLAFARKRVGSAFALISTLVLMAVLLFINLEYFQYVIPDGLLLFLGYFVFLFLQSLVLAFRFSAELEEARKMAIQGLTAKTEFLSTMSHEIRTPLNAVIGMTNLLKKGEPRADQQEQLDVMLFSARNLLTIVNDILDYNKIEAGKIEFERIPVDLKAMCRAVEAGFRSFAEEKGIELSFEGDERLDRQVLTDPTRLTQVLTNLVHNAIKFTNEGSVKLSLEVLDLVEKEKVRLRISVKDTGIGIAPDKVQLIFDRFTQADSSTSRRFGGTGLGLAIARRILELMDSRLQLRSQEGKGSDFWFELSLPINDQAVASTDTPVADLLLQEQEDAHATALLEGALVLLVDDNVLNLKVAASFLKRWGVQVDMALNGEQALQMFKPSEHQVVFMDLHMPMMDGYEATRQFRARGYQVPIIALTASMPREVAHEALTAGVNAVLMKPFQPNDLKKALVAQLDTKAKEGGEHA